MQPILEVFTCAMGSRPWFLLPVIPCKSKPGYRCPNWKWVDFPSTKNWVYHGSPTLDCTRMTIPSCSHMYIYIYINICMYTCTGIIHIFIYLSAYLFTCRSYIYIYKATKSEQILTWNIKLTRPWLTWLLPSLPRSPHAPSFTNFSCCPPLLRQDDRLTFGLCPCLCISMYKQIILKKENIMHT